MNNIVTTFMQTKDLVQIYHWQTSNYARHVAAGDLYNKLNTKIDLFVEAYQRNSRINIGTKSIKLTNMSNTKIDNLLSQFAKFLVKITSVIKNNPDLLNIRDEILADINQTIYLFTLN